MTPYMLLPIAGTPEKNEHRTSNVERPTSNNEFCQYYNHLDKDNSPFEVIRINIQRFVDIKKTKHSVINIGSSMLGVRCSTFINIFIDLTSRLFDRRSVFGRTPETFSF